MPTRPTTLPAPQLSMIDLEDHLERLSTHGWTLVRNQSKDASKDLAAYDLRRTYIFHKFKDAMAFVQTVADIANKEKVTSASCSGDSSF